ncbi:hypothetical protein CEXT_751071 [Caerostris extrusa]|uniref:Uncharacterized protein n=1 Tax=Caerostris extrusa TaxID=172846 RepID=A0AAV4U0Z9_CAEEX|nr:hypothetical protein CEXT_751071 [Caerostris extrusa]
MKKRALKKLTEEKMLGSAESNKADPIKWIYVKVRKQKSAIYRAIAFSRLLKQPCSLEKSRDQVKIKRKRKRHNNNEKKGLLKKLTEEKELGSAENNKADPIKWIYVKVRKQKSPIYRAIVFPRPLQANSYSEAPESCRPGTLFTYSHSAQYKPFSEEELQCHNQIIDSTAATVFFLRRRKIRVAAAVVFAKLQGSSEKKQKKSQQQ